jgi:type IV secretory pathway protease TraF
MRLPQPFLGLADARGYLPSCALLLKRVAAQAGDVVCRSGTKVSINGRLVALARTKDALGRSMPRWGGCQRMEISHVFVLADTLDSFDSRYFGPIARPHVLGTALPIWQSYAPTY